MTVSPKDIAWGSYQQYEGPFFRGSIRYSLPDVVTEDERRLRVMVATEGGSYDAINMYDRCIVSVGLIQWCEARYYLISKLLHVIAENAGAELVTGPLQPALELCCAEFKKNEQGQWRFHFCDERGEVNSLQKQQELFLGSSGDKGGGLKGTWTPINKVRAKLWASCMANVWQDPRARQVQNDYTITMLTAFMRREGKAILWDEKVPDDGWPGMLRAAFLTYALNNPARANKHIQVATGRLKSPKWSSAWCIGVLRELTFGPNIAIYSHRYEAIRPWLERLWVGVELPKTAEDLEAWVEPLPEVLQGGGTTLVSEVTEDLPEPKSVEPTSPAPKKEEPAIVLREPTPPTIEPTTTSPTGILGWILYVLHVIMTFFLKKDDKDE
jgi:hypothetical protein